MCGCWTNESRCWWWRWCLVSVDWALEGMTVREIARDYDLIAQREACDDNDDSEDGCVRTGTRREKRNKTIGKLTSTTHSGSCHGCEMLHLRSKVCTTWIRRGGISERGLRGCVAMILRRCVDVFHLRQSALPLQFFDSPIQLFLVHRCIRSSFTQQCCFPTQ